MAHHWMTNVSDDTAEVMNQRSSKGGSSAGPLRDKFCKEANDEADRGLERYRQAMALDAVPVSVKPMSDVERTVRRTLEILEHMQVRSMRAINPRNTPFVRKIVEQIEKEMFSVKQ